jgi:hypothetical protein
MLVRGKFVAFNNGTLVYNTPDGILTNVIGVKSISHIDEDKMIFELIDDKENVSSRDSLLPGDYFIIEEFQSDGTTVKTYGIASSEFDPSEDFCVYSVCAFSLDDMSQFINGDNSYDAFLLSDMSSRICSIWDESTMIYRADDKSIKYINECLANMGVCYHNGIIARYIKRCPLNGEFYYISKYFDICKIDDTYSIECDRLYKAKNYFTNLPDAEDALHRIINAICI